MTQKNDIRMNKNVTLNLLQVFIKDILMIWFSQVQPRSILDLNPLDSLEGGYHQGIIRDCEHRSADLHSALVSKWDKWTLLFELLTLIKTVLVILIIIILCRLRWTRKKRRHFIRGNSSTTVRYVLSHGHGIIIIRFFLQLALMSFGQLWRSFCLLNQEDGILNNEVYSLYIMPIPDSRYLSI